MIKADVTKQLFSLVLGVGVCILPSSIMAQTKTPDATNECSKELLLAYFPEIFVKATLAKFNVAEDKRDTIIRQLNEKDKQIIKLVEEKAAKLNPNPLKDPQHRQEAVKLFRDTLLEQFSGVLKANGVTDDKEIQSMLDDIQQQKAKRFAMCIKQAAAKDDDSDDKSDDDSDENYGDEDDNDYDDDPVDQDDMSGQKELIPSLEKK